MDLEDDTRQPTPPRPRNSAGNPVQGDDFFDREREQRRIWRDLETDNLLLLAPRRVGKTSLMLRLRETAELHEFRAVYATVADVPDEQGFVRRLYQRVLAGDQGPSVLQRLRLSAVGRFLRRISPSKLSAGPVEVEFSSEASERWSELGDALAQALHGSEGRWVVLVDELPIFVLALLQGGDSRRARRFLSWFRVLRQGTPHVRWLLAGSIGLDTVARRHHLSDTINDLNPTGLGAFEPEVARAFLVALDESYGLGLTPQAVQAMIEKVDWCIPYFLQLLYREIRNLVEDRGIPADVPAVELAWAALLEPSHRGCFDHWRQRLHEQLGRAQALQAERLLHAACQPGGTARTTLSLSLSASLPDPTEREEALDYCLDVLQTDGYLAERGERFRFLSPLLRDWWRRYHAR